MGLLSKIFRPSVAKAEGQATPGPWLVSDGWIPADWSWNFWQTGRDPLARADRSTMVEACVSAYAQTVAMCPGSHWRTLANGGRERVTASALNRILRKPNTYQTISDFLLNLTRSLYTDGNAYALAIRNDRFEVDSLHLMDPRRCDVSAIGPDGELFYDLSGNPVIERLGIDLRFVPQRDVLHIRLGTSARRPFKGEGPLVVAALAASTQSAMVQQQLAFIANQSRPSGTLNTDMTFTPEQVAQLRERWEEQSRGLNAGKVPILTGGLKWQSMAQSAADAQLAEIMKMTREDIALAYRVPLQILGLGGAPFSSTEALMQSWVSQSLGFTLNHIEEAFGAMFALKGYPEEYFELDTAALLRSAFKDRIEGITRAVQGGIYSPNEARRLEGYPDAEGGDEPRVQQQVVPLSFGAEPPAPPPAPVAPAPEPDPAEERANESNIIRAFREGRRVAV